MLYAWVYVLLPNVVAGDASTANANTHTHTAPLPFKMQRVHDIGQQCLRKLLWYFILFGTAPYEWNGFRPILLFLCLFLFQFRFLLLLRYSMRSFVSILSFYRFLSLFLGFASSWLSCVHFVALCFVLCAMSIECCLYCEFSASFGMNWMVLRIGSSWSFFQLLLVSCLFLSLSGVKLMAFPLCWNTRPHLFKGKTFFALTRHHIKHHLCQCELSCFTFGKILMGNYRYRGRMRKKERKRSLFLLIKMFE